MHEDAPVRQGTQRTQEHDAMLREALARPGVREAMEVYEHAERRTGRRFSSFWPLTRRLAGPTTTDHTNADTPVRAANADLE